MPKRSIRAQFLAQRKALPQDRCDTLSEQIQKKFLCSELFAEVKFLALYCAVHNEVSTDMVGNQALAAGKRVAYPRVAGENLEFAEVASLDDLVPGAFTVPEPVAGNRVALGALDLVVVPGIVFDRTGHRLGYGRGYYDRALEMCRPDCQKVGFAYDFQVIGTLPIMEEHDRTLSVLMTEQRRLNFTNR
ncbi:MAG: 5-formyltetrahydrofolate cyclo-ligase [Desulfuromonadales bacterium]|jgi:5-formyltetrahydrofolate cyclo-ligase